MSQCPGCNETWTCQQTGPKIRLSEQPGRWFSIAGPVQASSLSCPTSEPSRLRTMTIMKSVRFSYSLFVSFYFLVLKVIKLLLFGPSRSSNCIGLLIEKDNIILTT